MADITLSASVRSNLLSLQRTADLMATTQNRLSTGKKVNSALDNPTNFFTASALNSRATDLSNLLDSLSNSIKTLEAADNGIKSITKLVETAQGTARQALQNAGTNARVTGTVSGLTAGTDITTAFTDDLDAGDTITVGDGTTTATFTVAANDTVQDFIDAVNNTSGIKIAASLTSEGKIKLEALSTNSIVIGGSATAAEKAELGLADGTTTGTENANRTALAKQFDDLRTQITQLARDAGFNGINLLNGDSLKVVFNEKTGANQSSLAISGVTFDSAGLGIDATSDDFQSDTEINNSLDDLTAAITTLRSQASTFGSNLSVVQNRKDFTKSMINTLMSGADSLVLADLNEEGANMLALQTRQQLSTTALSLAAQSEQGVLRLF